MASKWIFTNEQEQEFELQHADNAGTGSLNLTDIARISNSNKNLNKVLNGSFQVNQSAYVSGGAVGIDKYGHDGWFKCSDGAGTKATGNSYTFSTVENLTTITIPSGQFVGQIIEGLNLQSGVHTINWVGTATCYVNGVAKAKGSQVTLNGGTNATIVFTDGTLTDVMLNEGSIAYPYERLDYQDVLLKCMRYYQWFTWTVGESYALAGSTPPITTILPVVMRVSPSVFEEYISGGNVGSVATSGTNTTSFHAMYTISAAAGWYRNSAYRLNARL